MEEPQAERAERPRLGRFIREQRGRILSEWEAAVRALPVAGGLSRPRLMDHMPHLLDGFSRAVETGRPTRESGLEGLPEAHALDRLDEGFDLGEVATEYALLRTCILRLFRAAHGEAAPSLAPALEEVERLDLAIDEAIVVSVARYARARERTLVALDRISEAALEGAEEERFLPRLLQVLLETTAAVDTAVILLREGDRLVARAAVGLGEDACRGFEVRVGEGFSGRVAAEARPLLLHSAATEPLVMCEALRVRGTRALYGVPLMEGGQVVGVTHIGSRTAWDFSREDRLLFRTMASRAAALLTQARLRARERDAMVRAEAARAAAERKAAELEATLESLPDAVYIGDAGGIRHANAAALEMLGFTRPEELYRDVPTLAKEVLARDAADGHLLAPEEQPFLQALNGVRSVRELLMRNRRTGKDVVVRSAAAPIRMRDEVVGAVAVNVDVTERKRQEEELRRAAEFRERFLGMVGHDLRGPLQAITLSANTLLRSEELPERVGRTVRRIANNAERMGRMIGDLLDFTRGRLGGGIPITRSPFNLCALTRHVLEDAEVAHPGRTLHLHAHGDFQGSWDEDRLAQVVGNLVNNALAYSPEGTPVDVTLTDEGPWVRVAVHNAGVPIPPGVLPTLFEPFRRGQEGGTRGRQGLGLGLYIVREIVSAHGGTLEARSSAGEGTTFTVRLPREGPGEERRP